MRKPFNLEQAVAGKPVVTRQGEHVLSIVSFVGIATTAQFPVVFTTGGIVYTCKADGRVYNGHNESPRDLFMEVEDEVLWVNVYRTSAGELYTFSLGSKEAADKASGNNDNVRVNGKAYKLILN